MIPDRLPEEYDDDPRERKFRAAGWIVVASIVAAFAIGSVTMLPSRECVEPARMERTR
jgi:hypothetical protein